MKVKQQKSGAAAPTQKTSYGQTAPKREVLVKADKESMPLARINFILMIASAVLIIVGFLLMLGGGSTTEQFNPDIFSTRRVVIGPTISFLGFVAMAVAIIVRPRREKNTESKPQNAE